MRAARLHPNATSLVIEDVPEPKLRPGSVIVHLEAAFASHFMTKIVDGSGGYTTPPRPFTPGMDAIGSVESVADGIRGLSTGDRVYCDNYFEPQYPASTGERAFLGNFAMGTNSTQLLEEWPDGVYAEKVCLPADCVVPIRPDPDSPASILCRLGWLGTAYAGLRKADMPPGAVVAVNGASGLLGSSAVLVALALGASQVVALGRRAAALDAVAAIDPRIVASTDASTIPPVDVALTSVDGADAASLEVLMPRVRRRGTFVVVGAPKVPLALNVRWLMANEITLRGSLWFERGQVAEMLRLAASGRMALSAFEADVFELSRITEALAAAQERNNPLRHVAISCN
jgi:D-arabinose 1-dehydrogenase-like Zn-dependent alcohol dehydrogenase